MTVFDVARYILNKLGSMSSWKLQKLCYYAQAWTLAWGDAPLFEEDFQAWANGPVCPELFFANKGCFTIKPEMVAGHPERLTPEQKNNIDIVLESYGGREAYWLREQTHAEAPWKNARGNAPEGSKSNAVITKEAMGQYYGSL